MMYIGSGTQIVWFSVGMFVCIIILAFMTAGATYVVRVILDLLKKKKRLTKDIREITDERIFRFVEEARRDFEGNSSNN